ncbi:MAG: hypothetical protein K2J42_08925 [Muribaculaceae bacterium]|nr:hypothetical protein [Muribaculaceae bacterium]MDE6810188.1 hypothetical protein [Muribaculaceae bacterium]
MTQFISHLAIFLILFTTPSFCFASTDDDEDESIEVIVTDEILTKEDPDNNGRRTAPRPIHITISTTDGVSIPNVDKSEVSSYEIYDNDGYCLASYINDKDFARHIFSTDGILQIKLLMKDRLLIGWI